VIATSRWSPSLRVGLAVVGVLVLLALLGPLLVSASPTAQDLDAQLLPPGPGHWLGTDENGVDLMAALAHGLRLGLVISLAVLGITLVSGTLLGLVAGLRGGRVDEALMRGVDVVQAFPGVLLNIFIVSLVQRPSVALLVLALSTTGWVGYARLARAEVLAVRERDYVQAARALGLPPWRVAVRHVLPNITAPLIVQASFSVAGTLLAEATLSFLGLGPPVSYSLGSLLSQGTTYLWRTHHLATFPGLLLALAVLGFNLLGDGLRDRLDPKQRPRD
jgi:peptide/nickel transport system permease protein